MQLHSFFQFLYLLRLPNCFHRRHIHQFFQITVLAPNVFYFFFKLLLFSPALQTISVPQIVVALLKQLIQLLRFLAFCHLLPYPRLLAFSLSSLCKAACSSQYFPHPYATSFGHIGCLHGTLGLYGIIISPLKGCGERMKLRTPQHRKGQRKRPCGSLHKALYNSSQYNNITPFFALSVHFFCIYTHQSYHRQWQYSYIITYPFLPHHHLIMRFLFVYLFHSLALFSLVPYPS